MAQYAICTTQFAYLKLNAMQHAFSNNIIYWYTGIDEKTIIIIIWTHMYV